MLSEVSIQRNFAFLFSKDAKMIFFDIHTHNKQAPTADNCIQIYNLTAVDIAQGVDESASNQYYSYGIHPWHIKNEEATMDDVRKIIAEHRKVVAIGECGLDKLIDTPMQVQMQVFEKHIELAEQLKLPLIIHCVKAWDELLQLHKYYKPQTTWIVHGFRGKAEQTKQLMKFGFHFSLGQYFDTETLKAIYPQHLFLETDDCCINIQEIYSKAFDVLPFSKDEIVDSIEQNVNRLFNL